MKKTAFIISGIIAAFCLGFFSRNIFNNQPLNKIGERQPAHTIEIKKENNMKLGAFSISLNVKDLNTSKEFYENLGFTVLAGSMDNKYLIMKNENALIGLFQGFFQGNILTFNPGWDENGNNTDKFNDVREIQQLLKNKAIPLTLEADTKTTGPASLMTTDPDGNVILIDQHR